MEHHEKRMNINDFWWFWRFVSSYGQLSTCQINWWGPPPLGAACWMCAATELASSSSYLQALVFIFKPSCLQCFASISLFNFLHGFWLSWKASSPLHNPPHRPAHSAVPIRLEHFFKNFCIFLLSIFLLFFRLDFFAIFADFEAAWGPQNRAKIRKMLVRKRFSGWISCLC